MKVRRRKRGFPTSRSLAHRVKIATAAAPPSLPHHSILKSPPRPTWTLWNPGQPPTQVKTIQEFSRTPHFPPSRRSALLRAKPLGKTTPRSPLPARGSKEPGPAGGPRRADRPGSERGTRVGLKEGSGSWRDDGDRRKKGMDRRLGGVRTGEGTSTGEGRAAGRGAGGVGARRGKIRPTDRGEEARGATRGRPTRGRGRGRRANARAAAASAAEGPHWGRCGEAAASCQEWGSRALTALLPQEHQLEFPQRIPEVSARGHDGAGGAAPPQPKDLPDRRGSKQWTERLENGRAPSSLGRCRARSGARPEGRAPRHRQAAVAAASPQSRLAPSEARGWEGNEGGVGSSQGSAQGSEGQSGSLLSTRLGGWGEGGGAGAADAPGTSHTQRFSASAAAAAAQPAECASLWRGAGRARARACRPASPSVRACVRARARHRRRLPGLACFPGSAAAETGGG